MAENKIAIHAPGKAPRVLVFDFGGVLFDWNPRHLFRHFFIGDDAGMERFLAEIDFDSWNAAMDRGQPFSEAVQEQSTRFPQYAERIRAFDARWEETVGGPIQGMPELLLRLHRAGTPLYAFSNTSAEKLPVLKSKYPFLDLFLRIITSGESRMNKPDPRLFSFFLKKTGLKKESLLFIDDTPVNIAAAHSLGWDAVLFVSTQELTRELAGRMIL